MSATALPEDLHETVVDAAALSENDVFGSLPQATLLTIFTVLKSSAFQLGETVVRQGDPLHGLYVIVSGEVRATHLSSHGAVDYGTKGPGEMFGDIEILHSVSSLCTATAETPKVRCLFLDKKHVDIFAELKVKLIVNLLPMLEVLPQADLIVLSNQLEPCCFSEGERIIEQGAVGDCAFFLTFGSVIVTQKRMDSDAEEMVTSLNSGSLFGEMSLIDDRPRRSTVSAISTTCCLRLRRSGMQQVLEVSTAFSDSILRGLYLQRSKDRKLRSQSAVLAAEVLRDDDATPPRRRTRRPESGRTRGMIKQYVSVQFLGDGSLGPLHLVQDVNSNQLRVMKTVRRDRLRRDWSWDSALTAAATSSSESSFDIYLGQLLRLDHPNVLGAIEVIDDIETDDVFLIFKYLSRGPVHRALEKSDAFPMEQVKIFARQLVSGLQYLHRNHLYHGNLKLNNVLRVDSDSVCLSDPYFATLTDTRSVLALSPDQLRDSSQLTEIDDVWGLGTLLYLLAAGRPPWPPSTAANYLATVSHSPLIFDPSLEKETLFVDLVRGMLCADARRRLSLSDIANHPWLDTLEGRWPKSRSGSFLAPGQAFSSSRLRSPSLPDLSHSMSLLDLLASPSFREINPFHNYDPAGGLEVPSEEILANIWVPKFTGVFYVAERTFFSRYKNALGLRFAEPVSNSMFFFTPSNRIRKGLRRALSEPKVDLALLSCILIWSLLIAVKSPDIDGPSAFPAADIFFTCLFSVEIAARIVVQGFLFLDRAFLRSALNMIDFLVVVLLWIQVFGKGWSYTFVPLRLFRLFIPIHLLQTFAGIQQILRALKQSIRGLATVFLSLIFWFVMFSIAAVNIYSEALRRQCITDDTNVPLIRTVIPGRWCKIYDDGTDNCPARSHCEIRDAIHDGIGGADNFGTGLMFVYQINVKKWTWSILIPMLDAVPEYPTFTYAFPSVILLLLGILTQNLFSAVIWNSFANIRLETKKRIFSPDLSLSAENMPRSPAAAESGIRAFFVTDPALLKSTRALILLGENGWRVKLRKVLEHVLTEIFILATILANAIFLMLQHEGQSEFLSSLLSRADLVFVLLFSLEISLRLIAYGFSFVKSPMNIFDLGVMAISDAAYILSISAPNVSGIASLRTIRIFRILRLVYKLQPLWRLMQTLSHSFATVMNMLFFMVFSIIAFAIVGHHLMFDSMPNRRFNYQTFWRSCVTLFQVSTGEGWFDNELDGMVHTSGARRAAISLFINIYHAWQMYVLLNLLIACILENFNLDVLEALPALSNSRRASLDLEDPEFWAAAAVFNEKSRKEKAAREAKTWRGKLRNIRDHPLFANIFLLMTVLSTMFMCLEGPPGREDIYVSASTLDNANYIFVGIFFVEFTVKVAVDFREYFSSAWDLIDFLVLVLNFVQLGLASIPAARIVRTARIIRSLKVVGYNQDMKNVFRALLQSGPTLGWVTVLALILTLVFAVYGQDLFGGKLYFCSDVVGVVYPMGKTDCLGTHTHIIDSGLPVLLPRSWRLPPQDFENIGNSFIAMYRAITLYWSEVAVYTIDMTESDKQKSRYFSSWAWIFWIVFIFFARFFIVSLFVTVIIEYYNSEQKRFLPTRQQRSFAFTKSVSIRRHIRSIEAPPSHPLRRKLFSLEKNNTLHNIGGGIVLVNVLFLSTYFYGQPGWWRQTHEIAEICFICVYAGEVILKLTALGPERWARRGWYIFEAAIVLASVAGAIFEHAVQFRWGKMFVVFCKISRCFRLVSHVPVLFHLMWTLAHSALPLLNILILSGLVNIIWGAIGVFMFGNIKSGRYLRYVDFENWPIAFMTLFRIACFDLWDIIMEDSMVSYPECTLSVGNIIGDCGPFGASIFFISYTIIASLVMLNVICAVISNHFSQLSTQKYDSCIFADENFSTFHSAWKEFDENSTGFIPLQKLQNFLSKVSMPFRPELIAGLGSDDPHIRFGGKNLPRLFFRCVRGEILVGIRRKDNKFRRFFELYLPHFRRTKSSGENAHKDQWLRPFLKVHERSATPHEFGLISKFVKFQRLRRRYNIIDDVRAVEADLHSGTVLMVEYEMCLRAVVNWLVTPLWFPAAERQERLDEVIAVRAHVAATRIAALIRSFITRKRLWKAIASNRRGDYLKTPAPLIAPISAMLRNFKWSVPPVRKENFFVALLNRRRKNQIREVANLNGPKPANAPPQPSQLEMIEIRDIGGTGEVGGDTVTPTLTPIHEPAGERWREERDGWREERDIYGSTMDLFGTSSRMDVSAVENSGAPDLHQWSWNDITKLPRNPDGTFVWEDFLTLGVEISEVEPITLHGEDTLSQSYVFVENSPSLVSPSGAGETSSGAEISPRGEAATRIIFPRSKKTPFETRFAGGGKTAMRDGEVLITAELT